MTKLRTALGPKPFRIWLAPPAAAAHFDPASQSFADRQRWERMGAAAPRTDWAASRALLAHVGTGRQRRSLSHSRGFAALAAGPDGARSGVDVEQVDPRHDAVRLARFAFAASEAEQLAALPPDAQAERFYVLWTLKEACIKALGLTLLGGLKRCIFTRGEAGWHAQIPTALAWEARVFRPRPTLYLAAIFEAPHRSDRQWECREWPEPASAPWPMLLAIRLRAEG